MNLLSAANLKAHEGRPPTPEGRHITLWRPSERFLHCCIESRGCRYNRDAGACVMCDYGIGRCLEPEELSAALASALNPWSGKLDTLLLGSYGSVFDPSEISEECFEVLLRFLRDYPVQTVIFETHCATVSPEKLALIRRTLPEDRRIVVEMGYESCDPFVLEHCLNKILSLPQLESAIRTIHSAHMSACLNVFLGAPFLSPADQLESARASVLWALERGADSLVLFPANIKPFTLLYKLYEAGHYTPLSQWMVPALFRRLPAEALERITLSWYGDRKNFYEHDRFPLIPPQDCPACHDAVFAFYRSFLRARSGQEREDAVRRLWELPLACSCREKLTRSLEESGPRYTKEQISAAVEGL